MAAMLRGLSRTFTRPQCSLAILTVVAYMLVRPLLWTRTDTETVNQSVRLLPRSLNLPPPMTWRDRALNHSTSILPPCRNEDMQLAGQIPFPATPSNVEPELERTFPEVTRGGHWSPWRCAPAQTLAVIVPFRDTHGDRRQNLMVLLHQLHTLLQRQLRNYTIYIVQQNGTNGWFNKALLMNLGFTHVTRSWPDATCVVLHDVDVVPVDDRNMYTCGDAPRHLVGNLNNSSGPMYKQATGGALILTPAQLRQVNGFSNRYWGWGNEDDDLDSRNI